MPFLKNLMRARRVITRSGRGIRGKFPSKKLNKQVHWESLLERDAVLMFELHPLIVFYQEQPSKETYYDATGQAFTCYPDFLIRLCNGKEVLVEVKREVDLARSKTSVKLELIAMRFAEQERAYRVLSERDLRREPLHSNLLQLWEATKGADMTSEVHAIVDALSDQHLYKTAELSFMLGSERTVLALIACGRLRTNLEAPLGANGYVWTALNQEAGDGSFHI